MNNLQRNQTVAVAIFPRFVRPIESRHPRPTNSVLQLLDRIFPGNGPLCCRAPLFHMSHFHPYEAVLYSLLLENSQVWRRPPLKCQSGWIAGLAQSVIERVRFITKFCQVKSEMNVVYRFGSLLHASRIESSISSGFIHFRAAKEAENQHLATVLAPEVTAKRRDTRSYLFP